VATKTLVIKQAHTIKGEEEGNNDICLSNSFQIWTTMGERV